MISKKGRLINPDEDQPKKSPLHPTNFKIETAEDLLLARLLMGAQPTLLMVAAAEARVFDTLGENEMSSSEIAVTAKLNPRATTLVLDGLVGLGILKKKNGYYRNTPASLSHLRIDTDHSHAVRLWISGTRLWEHLPYILRTGKLPENGNSPEPWKSEEQDNHAFIRSMYDLGWITAQSVIESLDFAGVEHFVDLGGGPGHYTIAALERSSETRATLVDLPLTLLVANTSLNQRGLLDRTKLVACDLFDSSQSLPVLPGTADLVLISNVIHMEGAEQNMSFIKRASQLLAPGGRLIIHDMFLEEDRTSPQASSLFAVHLLAMTQRGELYPASVICNWMAEAGLSAQVLKETPFLIEGKKV